MTLLPWLQVKLMTTPCSMWHGHSSTGWVTSGKNIFHGIPQGKWKNKELRENWEKQGAQISHLNWEFVGNQMPGSVWNSLLTLTILPTVVHLKSTYYFLFKWTDCMLHLSLMQEPLPGRNFTFWEWFYAILKLAKDWLQGPWKAGWVSTSVI